MAKNLFHQHCIEQSFTSPENTADENLVVNYILRNVWTSPFKTVFFSIDVFLIVTKIYLVVFLIYFFAFLYSFSCHVN